MRLFLAGIMQGSHRGLELHDQTYRQRLRELLERHLPGVEVYDPLADHAESVSYDESTGRRVFWHHNQLCTEVDVVLAFVPEASMGTAIEMWQAYEHGRTVVTISPLRHNWAVRFLSHLLYEDAPAFERELVSGTLARKLTEHTRRAG